MLSARLLTVRNRQITVFRDFSRDFSTGSFTAVLGPNGSGKTSLLRCLSGTTGRIKDQVFWKDTCLTSLSFLQRSRIISWLPAGNDLPFAFTVQELLTTGRFPWHQGLPGKQDHRVVSSVLEQLKLTDFKNRPFHTLSSGEQGKVMAGRILCQNTKIMILDEPCAHLDISISFDIMQLFREKSRQGHCVILSLHRPELALQYADDGILLSKDTGPCSGPVAEVCNEYNLSKAFGISAKINMISGRPYINLAPRKEQNPL